MFGKQKILVYAAALIWAGALAVGLLKLMNYSFTPGEQAETAARWPQSTLKLNTGRPNLVLFLHPKCSCSTATLGELDRLLTRLKNQIYVRIVFYKPAEHDDNWAHGAHWKNAQALASETVIDTDNKIAADFGARTSGHTFLYDENGLLVFSGGLTPARGHMGDSLGRTAILNYFSDANSARIKSKVFGCSLGTIAAATPVETP